MEFVSPIISFRHFRLRRSNFVSKEIAGMIYGWIRFPNGLDLFPPTQVEVPHHGPSLLAS